MLPLTRFKVKDRSMEPYIMEGQQVIVNRLAYLLRGPSKGDVVVLRHPNEERYLVKRIVDVAADGYSVAGDNEQFSVDSRAFGPVGEELIVGKVLFRIRS